ncbi:MAG: F0F1 ATP synthase subunit epsilon [Betaproteobacteria bacterium TMED41]|nr:MAG: F0F1 ATP synthase subunit epsilon [Betaproteobacteria bacterium TMED41]
MNNFKLDVVSAHESMYSGEIKFVIIPGEEGELGIYPGHIPLITRIKPGSVRFNNSENEQEIIVVAGGILEVQPTMVTVLADTAIRANDIDQERAEEAKKIAESKLKNNTDEIDLARAHAELAFAIAELKAIKNYRGKK